MSKEDWAKIRKYYEADPVYFLEEFFAVKLSKRQKIFLWLYKTQKLYHMLCLRILKTTIYSVKKPIKSRI